MYGYIDSEDAVASQLAAADAARDVTETRKLMKRVLQLSTSHCHRSSHNRSLLPHVVKLLALPDLVIKKLASWYLLEASDHQDLVLLAVNTLLKDCRDANPMIRGQALRTLASFRQAELAQYAIDPTMSALQDSSVYVRRIAVTGCAKIHSSHPQLVSDSEMVDKLYGMIRDSDPVVVTNSLSTLDTILAEEGGVVINRNIAFYLLNNINKFPDWGLVTVFKFLMKYSTPSEDEVLDVMNLIDAYLKHHSSSVVYSCLQYFILLVSDLPQLAAHIFQRARPQLVAGLAAGNPELTFVLLEFISSVLDDNKSVFVESYQAFFCKYSEPVYVKEKKISLLPRLVTDDNCSEVIEELHLYCSDLDHGLSRQAIVALACVAQTIPARWQECLDHLLELLKMDIDYVTSNVLEVCQRLDLREYERLGELLSLLPSALQLLSSSTGIAAIWWLLGEYGEYFEGATYILEEGVGEVDEETGQEAQLQLLTAALKLFFKSPAEMQDCLGRALEVFSQSEDHDVRDRAENYYSLLQTDVGLTRRLILGREPVIHV